MYPSRPEGSALSQVAPAGYRLLELLGRGGMGEVYLADDLKLGRKVAIKFLLPDKTQDAEARRRLLREAQAAASLDHPGICTVFEVDETSDGRIYVAMQYVQGETLARVLERGPRPVRAALSMCSSLAEALAAAHHHGIIHRDLKPANVIVTPSGQPKLLDLGIAKIVARANVANDDRTGSGATSAGMIIGSPGYMSPEQVEQRPVDGRSDLFSLGVVLFECLTGRRAFDGSTTFETIANVLHVHPPAPSSLRPELTAGHDELCARLLAKDRDDRFKSADEVVGAIQLLLSQKRGDTFIGPDRPVRPWWSRSAPALIVGAIAILAAVGGWIWTRPRPLPPVPKDSQQWYERGTDALRDGASFTAVQMLQEATKAFPDNALAYARLAEAHAELDDETAAKDDLVRVSSVVSNEQRLPEVEKFRLQAARALVLRDVDTAVNLYRRLVDLVPDKSRAWLDVGRAQESEGLVTEARASYANAIAQDKAYAAAYLRLGTLHGLEANRREALEAFAEAERLYRATGNAEGVTETIIRRGALYDGGNEPKLARVELERALSRAEDAKNIYQRLRVQIALSSVTASEGRLEDAQKLARAALKEGTEHRLETFVADGLVWLAGLIQQPRPDEAAALLDQANLLAQRHGSQRISARANVQLAQVRLIQNRDDEALAIIDRELPRLQASRYRRTELEALSIKARALQSFDRLDEARAIVSNLLSAAEANKNESAIAQSAGDLALVTTSLGDFPAALKLRERVTSIRIEQGDQETLPYHFANLVDLLIRLGRTADAERLLAEIDANVSARKPEYERFAGRAAALRALLLATTLRCDGIPALLARVRADKYSPPWALTQVPALSAFCDARRKRAASVPQEPAASTDPSVLRERQYWLAITALERGDASVAMSEVKQGLTRLGNMSNDELRWRMAAVGALAARMIGDEKAMAEFTATAKTSLGRVRAAWTADFQTYEQRADLIYLRKRSGLS